MSDAYKIESSDGFELKRVNTDLIAITQQSPAEGEITIYLNNYESTQLLQFLSLLVKGGGHGPTSKA